MNATRVVYEKHTGPVQIRWSKDRVLVLCPLGHFVTSAATGARSDFAGSALEARISWHQNGPESDRWIVECCGATRVPSSPLPTPSL